MSKYRNKCLSREWFASKKEVQVIIEQWQHHYNHERPHSAPGYRPPSEVSGRQQAAA
ncbi:integrase core domain-containing protein [Nitratifractor sp.]|uniref:integrase core domain-containing protein n=1 Tax=Nitratifractor sp. TaxID=2268144 RepID=UPI003449F51C